MIQLNSILSGITLFISISNAHSSVLRNYGVEWNSSYEDYTSLSQVGLRGKATSEAIHLLSKLNVTVRSGYGFYAESGCSVEMFGGDSNAYWACVTQYAIQRNWFPSPIAGLYQKSYLDWNGFDGFWQNGVFLETMANFMHYTGSQRYSSIFTIAGHNMYDLLHAYYPVPSYDDEAWYGLSYARIYEMTGNATYLSLAEELFNWVWQVGWDNSTQCAGGLWFEGAYDKKITITNGEGLQLGAKLYRLLRKPEYLNRTYRILNYLQEMAINKTTYLVADSINITDCTQLPKYNVTYNSGLIIGGLVELYKVDGNKSHLDLAHKLAKAIISSNSDQNGVFMEYCEWDNQCVNDDDARQFKGLFVRNLRYLMDIDETNRRFYKDFLQMSINSLLANGQCLDNITHCNVKFLDGASPYPTQGPVFTTGWAGPFVISDIIGQSAVLDLFISGIEPNTTCVDLKGAGLTHGCFYDPPIPDVNVLDCTTDPCPKGHPCCTWNYSYSTCCTPDQKCINGGCY